MIFHSLIVVDVTCRWIKAASVTLIDKDRVYSYLTLKYA